MTVKITCSWLSASWAFLNFYREVDCIVATQVVLVVSNLLANAGDLRDAGLIPVSERSPGGGNANPLHYSCLENSMDREAWMSIVHKITKNRTQLKWRSRHGLYRRLLRVKVILFSVGLRSVNIYNRSWKECK